MMKQLHFKNDSESITQNANTNELLLYLNSNIIYICSPLYNSKHLQICAGIQVYSEFCVVANCRCIMWNCNKNCEYIRARSFYSRSYRVLFDSFTLGCQN